MNARTAHEPIKQRLIGVADSDCDMIDICSQAAPGQPLFNACRAGGVLSARCSVPDRIHIRLLASMLQTLNASKANGSEERLVEEASALHKVPLRTAVAANHAPV